MLGLVALAALAGFVSAGRTTVTFDYGWLFHLGDPPGSGVRVFIPAPLLSSSAPLLSSLPLVLVLVCSFRCAAPLLPLLHADPLRLASRS